MARIPLEDNYDDVLRKAQRGLGVSDADLASRAAVSAEDLASLPNLSYGGVASFVDQARDSSISLVF